MIGNTAGGTSPQSLNQQVGALAVNLRNVLESAKDYSTWFSKLQLTDIQSLFGLSPADAATLQTLVNYMSNVAGCYYGTVQQGGTGGTGAILFNFDNALAVLWGGQ